MHSVIDTVRQLTEGLLTVDTRQEALLRYAHVNGWRPSDQIMDYPGTTDFANGHLLVEHGLDNTAVISFLSSHRPFDQLNWTEQNRLVSISYNNLVDWHLFPERNGIYYVNNRLKPLKPKYVSLQEEPNAWRVEAFDKIVGRRVSANLPALDEALIKTVSNWKRYLVAELDIANVSPLVSELFNAMFFVRALEDDRRKNDPNERRLLLDLINSASSNDIECRSASSLSFNGIIQRALEKLGSPQLPQDLLDTAMLRQLDLLETETLCELVQDFYQNKFAPYVYDFSLMSKHALSRIYEHYISILKEEPSQQGMLFPVPPREYKNRAIGGIYTPQYIARFFARFLKNNHSLPRFRSLRVSDPACGSGIFLRTLMEMQCDPLAEIDVSATAETTFNNVLGIDVEKTACKATQLSLSLLHLVLTGKFPSTLRIVNEEAIEFVQDHEKLHEAFDAVIANPPYVKWENIPRNWRPRITEYLAEFPIPKADLYLAFIKVGLDLVKPGGFLLYVLPHAFLKSENAKPVREAISENCCIRFLADLSEVNVIDDASSYPILLVLEKKAANITEMKPAVIVRCTSYAGHALQDALDGHLDENPYYSIYNECQEAFREDTWMILSPKENLLREKISRFPKLEDFLDVKQGLLTG
jgi:type I restriction-modification system DNA methylase subunit